MRSRLVVPVLLGACLITAVAFAANDRVTAKFESLQASGVGGEAVLNPVPGSGTLVHGSITGLQANTDYVSRVYTVDGGCGSGTPTEEIVTFQSNPQGMAIFNKKIAQDLLSIRSISIELVSDNSVQACAPVTP